MEGTADQMRDENQKRFTLQLFLLLIFWGIATFTLITQTTNLPPEPLDIMEKISIELYRPDPYTYYPLEYNPFNDRMTLIEACAIWILFFYGNLRMLNIFRIIGEDDKETSWEHFWEHAESENI